MPALISALQTFNQLLTAGIAITAFSLLLYTLSFNLKNRVARSAALIFAGVMIVFTGEAINSVSPPPLWMNILLRLEWIGVIFLPPAYLHFSDALLATTGRPSRGRRRLLVRLTYLLSGGFALGLLHPRWMGTISIAEKAPYIKAAPLSWIFLVYYVVSLSWAWVNFWRAYRRTITGTGRRRMGYLIAGAAAPTFSTFPYQTYFGGLAGEHPLLFWLSADALNLLTPAILLVMAYAVAFYGVSWPDRVVKRRLFKWVMRGPVTASTVLAVTTLVRRAGEAYGNPYSTAVPIVMTGTLLLMQYAITMLAPLWERVLFYGGDKSEVHLVQTLEERMLTSSDLRQFLETLLTAVCDHLQIGRAFVIALEPPGMEVIVSVGAVDELPDPSLTGELRANPPAGDRERLFRWGDYWLLPLFAAASTSNGETPLLLGLLGAERHPETDLEEEQRLALNTLAERAALALEDRLKQQQVFSSLESLAPQVDWLQRLRAASRLESKDALLASPNELKNGDFARWVKDALSHYWGGPKLSKSPLMGLQVVQQALEEHDGASVNALRAILRQAIEQVRPEGKRRFTTEWLLYNILEMKFMEGRKVRDIATRLAMSEADLYRKQRVAIEAVANAILEMEQQARQQIQKEKENN
ncbi:MAG: hypothetical protein D6803_06545 [Anaerolineae bacterium]|nr:MAG: hypothetical protein D6803_06545 [Anaerolineae bacterium]